MLAIYVSKLCYLLVQLQERFLQLMHYCNRTVFVFKIFILFLLLTCMFLDNVSLLLLGAFNRALFTGQGTPVEAPLLPKC